MECLVCGSDYIEFLTDKGTKFTVEKSNICMNCGLVFLHPIMDDVEDYYLSDEFSADFRGEETPSDEKREKNKEIARVRWDAINQTIKMGGKLLEIGCSSGEFLDEARGAHELVAGIDASSGFVGAANGDNIHVGMFPDDLEKLNLPDEFDTIVSFHTLEHVSDPRKFLKSVWSHLSDEGKFIIEYPDVAKASLRPSFSPSYFQKSHLFDFSLFNISALLKEVGFEISAFATYEGFPRDKNVLLVCEKSMPHTTVLYRPDEAKALHGRISIKFSKMQISHNTDLAILHIASHHINIGDGAITAGIRQAISDIYEKNVQYINFDIVDYSYFGKEIDANFLNSYKPDIVLVGGGGTIDGHKMRIHNGTAFTMSMEEIDKLNAPIGFVGLGHNLFHHQEFFHADKFEEFIEFCGGKDIPFSVRDDGSFDRIQNMLQRDDLDELISVVPDPGFFVPVPSGISSPMFPPTDAPKVVIQIALDAYMHRFGGKEVDYEGNVNAFVKKISEYISYLIETYTASIVLATHTLDDIDAALMILRNLERRKARLYVRQTGIYHPIHAPMFFKTYADADLVVGMRGHSVICGTGLNTPTMGISTHDKVAGFMERAGAIYYKPEHVISDYDAFLDDTKFLLSSGDEYTKAIEIMTMTWYDTFKTYLRRCLSAI